MDRKYLYSHGCTVINEDTQKEEVTFVRQWNALKTGKSERQCSPIIGNRRVKIYGPKEEK